METVAKLAYLPELYRVERRVPKTVSCFDFVIPKGFETLSLPCLYVLGYRHSLVSGLSLGTSKIHKSRLDIDDHERTLKKLYTRRIT